MFQDLKPQEFLKAFLMSCGLNCARVYSTLNEWPSPASNSILVCTQMHYYSHLFTTEIIPETSLLFHESEQILSVPFSNFVLIEISSKLKR